MLKIGLTGGIGSGKTAVSDAFAELGIPVIDTDSVAHDLVTEDRSVLQEIEDSFGTEVLETNGGLNRQMLATIVFNDIKNKQRLEKILHPKIETEVKHQLQIIASSHNPPDYTIIVVPLLIETNFLDLIDRILVVSAEEKIRIDRVKQRDGRTVAEIRAIINNQTDDDERLSYADDIIENNSDIISLTQQIKNLHKKYKVLSATGR